jgi:hypothetical protein
MIYSAAATREDPSRMSNALDLALENARLAPSLPRWGAIVEHAAALSAREIDSLDAALAAWPDASRAMTTATMGTEATPSLRIARRLVVDAGAVDRDAMHALLTSPHAARVSSLALFGDDVTIGAVEAVIDAGGALTELQIGGTNLGDAASTLLADAALGVRILTFEGSGTTDASPIAIARGTGLATLAHLQYHDVQVGDRGLEALAGAPRSARLSFLRVSYADVGARGARAIARSAHLSGLTHLGFALNHVGPDGARAIARSKPLRALRSLYLAENRLGAAGVVALAEHARFDRLEGLTLGYNDDVGPDACRALVEAPWTAHLRELDVAGNAIGDAGLVALCRSPNMAALRDLNVSMNDLGDAAIEALLAAPFFARLERLDITHNANVGETALSALCDRAEEHRIDLRL